MEKPLLIKRMWSFKHLTVLILRDGTIENKTFDNDEETSVNVITNTPELAYFSKEGKIIKELEWWANDS